MTTVRFYNSFYLWVRFVISYGNVFIVNSVQNGFRNNKKNNRRSVNVVDKIVEEDKVSPIIVL